MVRTLELRATQDGVIWPSRPLISARGLLSTIKNLPLTTYDKAQLTRFRDVTFNSTGDLLAATDEKGRIFVFFIASNRYALVQHLGVPTIACCFSPIRKTELLVTCENETARCIDVQSQVLISTLRGHRYPARSASFQTSGKLALTASQDAVILWDTKDWSRFRVLNAGPGVEAATFVARGDLVAVCFQDDTIMMWELESLALQYRFSLPEHEPTAGLRTIAVSDDHRVLVASGRAPFVYVWDFEAQTIIRIIELPAPIQEVRTHAFVPGHVSTISVLERDGGLFFLDVAASKPRIQLEIARRDKKFTAFDIECHARYLAACSDDGYLLLYDLEIARDTAQRARAARRKDGLFDLDDSARLATRSGVVDSNARKTHPLGAKSHPVPSKLIDSLFGATTATLSRRREPVELVNSDDEVSRRPAAADPRARRPTRVLDESHTRHHRHVVMRERAPSATTSRRTSALTAPVATLSAQEIDVNRKRLEATLRCNGVYPSKYRLLVWRFLLRLPKNDEAFRSLVRKGKHPAFVRLHEQYPLSNSRLFRRLHRVLSAIAYWCPAFGEVSYLPEVVYPFVKLFRENDLAAFEASLSVLLHWCGDFLRALPYAPVAILTALDRALEHRDPQLYAHFAQLQVSAEVYGWSLLKTLFTEVLSEAEWLALWDHLFTASDTPELLYVAVLAYVSYFRSALLGATDRSAIDQFFHQQNALEVQAFLQVVANLRESLDLDAFRSRDDESSARDGASAPRKTHWPLPRGQYPAFSSYPKFVVDFQISERNRIALEEQAMVQQQQRLREVEAQCAKLKAEHEAWLEQKRLVLAAEEKRRTEALAAEKHRILHLKVLDEQTRTRRLERLEAMETYARESLETTSKMFRAEYDRLEATLAMQRERTDYELASRQQDEALERVEFETEQRVLDIHKQRSMAERLETLRTEFAARVQQHELEDLLKFETWKREDADRKRAVKLKLQRRQELAVLEQECAMRQKLEAELLRQAVAKERDVAALETERAARQHEQRAFDALDDEIDARTAELDGLRERRGVGARSDEAGRVSASRGDGADSNDDNDDSEEAFGRFPDHRDGSTPQTRANDRATESRHREGVRSAQQQQQQRDDSAADAMATYTPSKRSTLTEPAHTRRQTWTAPVQSQHRTSAAPSATRRATAPAVATTARGERPQTGTFAALNQSLLHSGGSSESSFTSAVLERTMEEMTLLERALRNISSSSSSNSSSSRASARSSRPSRPASATVRSGSGANARNNTDAPAPHDDRLAPRERLHSRSAAPTVSFAIDAAHDKSGADSDSDQSSHALQRPIAELERELGIRFDDSSDDERDSVADEGKREDDDGFSDDDGDGAIEDDRARLLERAKKLLEAEDFSSDDEDA